LFDWSSPPETKVGSLAPFVGSFGRWERDVTGDSDIGEDVNDEQLLINFLAERDTPCPHCGYNLRGLQQAACPECNQAIVLKLGDAEHKLAAMIVALLFLGFGVGVDTLVLVVVSLDLLGGAKFDSVSVRGLVTAALGLAVECAVLLALLRLRRQFQWLTPSTRWSIVFAIFVLTAINVSIVAMIP
jgi:hypothetical protein